MDSVEFSQKPKNSESSINPEVKIDHYALAIATITFYPGWYQDETVQAGDLTSKVRGYIGLQTLREAKEKGYQAVVVDGGSSDAFKAELVSGGIVPQSQLEKGYSAARQQSYMAATSRFDGAKVILSTEAEKFSVIRDCLTDEVIQPVLKGETDVVILKRDQEAFSTYPKNQAEYEQRANKLWNDIMRKHNLLSSSVEDLDIWLGPRLIRNDPHIVSFFLDKYEFEKRGKLDQIVDPFVYVNALFFPIIIVLRDGLRISSITVPYRHPPSQTQMENEDASFRRKRDTQYENIVSTMHFVRMLENNPKGRLIKI